MGSMLDPNHSQLIEAAARGDGGAREQLLERHRARLRHIVAVRLDRRLAARVDPSDVVQEALADASARMDEYFRTRPLPFLAWLRQFAFDRLGALRRRHVTAQRRSVVREEPISLSISDESAAQLACQLAASATSPSRRLLRDELRDQVRAALDALPERDREVLVMRHLEELDNAEIAAVLGLSEGAVRTRHVRALQKLRNQLESQGQAGSR
jgi:RNA polymerase sigma-70 factor (ECF subfamily)